LVLVTDLVARIAMSRGGAVDRPSAALLTRSAAAALALLLAAIGLAQVFETTSVSGPLALAGGIGLMAFLWLAIRHYDAAIAIGLLLMAVVRFEPAPTDLIFAVIMSVAAVTGRFRLRHVPPLLRWIVALLLVVNLASIIDVVSISAALRFLFITVYLLTFALWLTQFVDSPSRARLVAMTWLVIAVASAVVASLALHLPIPGQQLINGGVDNGERASGLFKDPNVFGPFLIPIALILLEQHIRPSAPRLLRMRAPSIWLCLLALTLGVLFSYSRAAWADYAIAITVMLAASSMRRRGSQRALRALIVLVLIGGLTLVVLSASGSVHFLEERAHLQSYDTHRFAAQTLGWKLGWTHPVGVGPGQFEYHSPVASHSTFVRVFSEQGFVGLLLWVTLLLATLVLALRNVVLGRDTYGIGSAALLGAWCGLIFNSTVVDTLHWRHLWVVVALIWAGAARRAHAGSGERAGPAALPRPRLARARSTSRSRPIGQPRAARRSG
jgi:O-antigen ligase